MYFHCSPRTIQQGNGVIPQKQPQPRAYDNTGMLPVDIIQGHGNHSNNRTLTRASHSNTGTLTRTNNYSGTSPHSGFALSNISCEYYYHTQTKPGCWTHSLPWHCFILWHYILYLHPEVYMKRGKFEDFCSKVLLAPRL